MGRKKGPRILTAEEARRFYDRFGRKQDLQGFYEDPAVDDLVVHSDFERATAVFEFGCGTGRLAERLLSVRLTSDCSYLGVDVSPVMVALARERLERWRPRAEVRVSAGSMRLDVASGRFDRFLATYVLDLLCVEDIETLLTEARRVLVPGGLLCLVSLTEGVTLGGRLVSWIWRRVHSLDPRLLGGCRPILLERLVPVNEWRLRYRRVITTWGICSEVLVAQR